MMKHILSIAGSDPSGGAGIQADLKTFSAHLHYGMSVVTSLTAQNTQGVVAIHEIPVTFFHQQLCCVLDDITPDAIKIGMVGNAELIHIIAECLHNYHCKNIVLDPVMVSTSGHSLLQSASLQAMIKELFPLATLLTPNLKEAEIISEMSITTKQDMEVAATKIATLCPGAILIKGGHLDTCSDDLLYEQGNFIWVQGERINNPNTHGTGCTLSSAIATHLGEGKSVEQSVREAKQYLNHCLNEHINIGKGNGPLPHMCCSTFEL